MNVRILSATNAKIAEAVSAREFREDLLYRLNTVEIPLPPLRERQEDIPTLALHFLRREATHYEKDVEGFSDEAMQALVRHLWPGNVRELEHAVERSLLMAQGDEIQVGDLGLRKREDGTLYLEQLTLDEAERVLIENALNRHEGNVSKTADALGLSRSALYRRLQRHARKRRVQHDPPDGCAERSSARFACRHHVEAAGLEIGGQALQLGCFSGTFSALERDEPSPHCAGLLARPAWRPARANDRDMDPTLSHHNGCRHTRVSHASVTPRSP